MTLLEEIAGWVANLTYEDIPDRIIEIARHQVLSVVGAVYASAGCAGGKSVIRTVSGWDDTGSCTVFPGGEQRPFFSALLQNCALSMALDYDDYLFLGHTGHSAVLAPLAVAQMREADMKTVMVAQVAANEIAGRLGASVVIGPHNGQMWAHIHHLGAAAAASKVLGLDDEKTADALGISLSEPVYPLFPGFLGPQSKLLTAAVPTVTGTTAAFLAENGMSGSRVILDDPEGFLAHFAFLPLEFMLTGFGSAWVTDTIAFKPYPGCAYIDTAVDALLEIMGRFSEDNGRDLEPDDVAGVDVEASLLTMAMDSMTGGYIEPTRLNPTNINFSLSMSLAMVLLSGTLSGAQFTDDYLSENRERILEIAARVNLAHGAPKTVEFLRSLDEVIDLKSMLAQIDLKSAMRARHRLKEHLSSVATMGGSEAVQAWKSLSPEDKAFLRNLVSLRSRRACSAYDLSGKRFEEAKMPFGARVSVSLKDGTELVAEKAVPRGGPGDERRLEVPPEKFMREGSPLLGKKRAKSALKEVLDIENSTPERLCKALSVGS